MQSTYILQPSHELSAAIQQDKESKYTLLSQEIAGASAQMAYMLQAYYPREKLSNVQVISGSITFYSHLVFRLKLVFTMEEFNVCSAINTVNEEHMTINGRVEEEGIILEAENWPERDAE